MEYAQRWRISSPSCPRRGDYVLGWAPSCSSRDIQPQAAVPPVGNPGSESPLLPFAPPSRTPSPRPSRGLPPVAHAGLESPLLPFAPTSRTPSPRASGGFQTPSGPAWCQRWSQPMSATGAGGSKMVTCPTGVAFAGGRTGAQNPLAAAATPTFAAPAPSYPSRWSTDSAPKEVQEPASEVYRVGQEAEVLRGDGTWSLCRVCDVQEDGWLMVEIHSSARFASPGKLKKLVPPADLRGRATGNLGAVPVYSVDLEDLRLSGLRDSASFQTLPPVDSFYEDQAQQGGVPPAPSYIPLAVTQAQSVGFNHAASFRTCSPEEVETEMQVASSCSTWTLSPMESGRANASDNYYVQGPPIRGADKAQPSRPPISPRLADNPRRAMPPSSPEQKFSPRGESGWDPASPRVTTPHVGECAQQSSPVGATRPCVPTVLQRQPSRDCERAELSVGPLSYEFPQQPPHSANFASMPLRAPPRVARSPTSFECAREPSDLPVAARSEFAFEANGPEEATSARVARSPCHADFAQAKDAVAPSKVGLPPPTFESCNSFEVARSTREAAQSSRFTQCARPSQFAGSLGAAGSPRAAWSPPCVQSRNPREAAQSPRSTRSSQREAASPRAVPSSFRVDARHPWEPPPPPPSTVPPPPWGVFSNSQSRGAHSTQPSIAPAANGHSANSPQRGSPLQSPKAPAGGLTCEDQWRKLGRHDAELDCFALEAPVPCPSPRRGEKELPVVGSPHPLTISYVSTTASGDSPSACISSASESSDACSRPCLSCQSRHGPATGRKDPLPPRRHFLQCFTPH